MKTEANLSGACEPNLTAAKQEPVLEQAKKPVLVKPEKPELVGIDLVTVYSAEGVGSAWKLNQICPALANQICPTPNKAKKLVLVKPEKPELVGIDLVTAYIGEGVYYG